MKKKLAIGCGSFLLLIFLFLLGASIFIIYKAPKNMYLAPKNYEKLDTISGKFIIGGISLAVKDMGNIYGIYKNKNKAFDLVMLSGSQQICEKETCSSLDLERFLEFMDKDKFIMNTNESSLENPKYEKNISEIIKNGQVIKATAEKILFTSYVTIPERNEKYYFVIFLTLLDEEIISLIAIKGSALNYNSDEIVNLDNYFITYINQRKAE